MRRRSFTFVKEFDDIGKTVGSADWFVLMNDIIAYGLRGEEPNYDDDSDLRTAWGLAKSFFDRMKDRDGLTINQSDFKLFRLLDDVSIGKAFRAMMDFVENGTEPDNLDLASLILFKHITQNNGTEEKA